LLLLFRRRRRASTKQIMSSKKTTIAATMIPVFAPDDSGRLLLVVAIAVACGPNRGADLGVKRERSSDFHPTTIGYAIAVIVGVKVTNVEGGAAS
jgi:hypothetical protein